MSLRTERKNQTRESLLNAVLEQCATGQSFSSLSLRQVTKLAGVVPATFYRHFKDMEELGTALVNEVMVHNLIRTYQDMNLNQDRGHTEQITASVDMFFEGVDRVPEFSQFSVAERWGGSPAVCKAINQQFKLFVAVLANDLGRLPAFEHISIEDRIILSDLGANMFFSWIMDWLNLGQIEDQAEAKAQREVFKQRCIRQARMLFYGSSNWKPAEVEAL